MDSLTFSLLTSSINPLNTNQFYTITTTSPTITTVNGTGNAAELTKTLIPEKYQVILLSFAYGIISLLAVIGNSCIIYIVLRNRRMHSITNYFICNLALADCLVACFAVPFQVCHFLKIIKHTHTYICKSSFCSFKRQLFKNGYYLIFFAN
jgi:hypothetical protein